MRHDRITANSEVLGHIMTVTGSDMPGAIKTFQYLRNSGHIVFTLWNRKWKGADYFPHETDEQFRVRVSAEILHLRKKDKENLDRHNKLQASHDELIENFTNLVKFVNQGRG
jgi:hypothetical protein